MNWRRMTAGWAIGLLACRSPPPAPGQRRAGDRAPLPVRDPEGGALLRRESRRAGGGSRPCRVAPDDGAVHGAGGGPVAAAPAGGGLRGRALLYDRSALATRRGLSALVVEGAGRRPQAGWRRLPSTPRSPSPQRRAARELLLVLLADNQLSTEGTRGALPVGAAVGGPGDGRLPRRLRERLRARLTSFERTSCSACGDEAR